MNFKIYSFFSGAGFLDLGFENAGYKIRLVNEFSKSFLSVYKYARSKMNLSEPELGFFNCDINDFLRDDYKKILTESVEKDKTDSLVGFIGGPPCPDFSIAGKNKGILGSNGQLTDTYKKLIIQQSPDFFLFENVKGLWSTKKHRESYEKIKLSFKRNGYHLIEKLVNSIEYGVPQDRERIILIGIKKKMIKEDCKHRNGRVKKQFSWGNKEKYSINRVRSVRWPNKETYYEDIKKTCSNELIEELTIEYWFKKNEVYTHVNSQDFFKPKQGKLKMQTINEGDVSGKSFKRLHRWRYSPTAAYGNNEVHLHPYKSRRLSVSEALAIQSLPQEFIVNPDITLSDKFKCIGNGVPYLMGLEIAKSLRLFLMEIIDKG